MVLASQCIMQPKPKRMLIEVNGELGKCVSAKDIVLYIIAKLTAGGGTGYFIEFAGSAIRALSMEGRMTVCNMSIEMGARGGLIAPDEKTFEYFSNREYAPNGEEWDKAIAYWKTLKTDEGAEFDKTYQFDAADIEPMITYGTNPGMGMKITGNIPDGANLTGNDKITFDKALQYMGFDAGQAILGHSIQYVFLGSCTNGRIEDFRAFTDFVKGRKKHPDVIAWLVPGSGTVERHIRAEGLDKILEEAGFELRQPGCSACLAMNDDKVPAGMYAVSTSNRNFEGRQGPGSRTLLAGPLVAAAAAVTGKITDPRRH
jgi:3-isopropylmalate/(R)-2-methylmalate dehydratase large subunit